MCKKTTIASRNIMKWFKNYSDPTMSFGQLEDKVYQECNGMNYNDTMLVFRYVMEAINFYCSSNRSLQKN